jgi:hypothetical protein
MYPQKNVVATYELVYVIPLNRRRWRIGFVRRVMPQFATTWDLGRHKNPKLLDKPKVPLP